MYEGYVAKRMDCFLEEFKTAYSIPSAEYWITNDYFPCYKCVNFLVDGTYESLTYTEKVLLENEEYVQDVVRDFYQ